MGLNIRRKAPGYMHLASIGHCFVLNASRCSIKLNMANSSPGMSFEPSACFPVALFSLLSSHTDIKFLKQ